MKHLCKLSTDGLHKALAALLFAALIMAIAGCATKTRTIDMMGMYATERGSLAIGKINVQAIPEGTDAALIKYSEDNAWLAPSMKLHEIGITLTGTNAVASATGIVEAICRAFQATAPAIATAATNTNYGTTMVDQMGKATEARKVIELGKQAVKTAATAAKKEVDLKKLETTAASTATTTTDCENCTDGTCENCEVE